MLLLHFDRWYVGGWPIGKQQTTTTRKSLSRPRRFHLIPRSDESDLTNETETLPEGAHVSIEVNGVRRYSIEEKKESWSHIHTLSSNNCILLVIYKNEITNVIINH